MKVQTGTYLADNRISNYSLAYGGELERTHEIFVRFQKPYLEKPEIITSVTVYDGSRDSNTRFEIKTKDVSKTGFTIVARTWGGTKIFAIGGTWMAIGN